MDRLPVMTNHSLKECQVFPLQPMRGTFSTDKLSTAVLMPATLGK